MGGFLLISIYKTEMSVCLSVCLSVMFERVAAEEDGKGGQEGGGNGEGHFYDGMPGWTYFSRATPGHPASVYYIR